MRLRVRARRAHQIAANLDNAPASPFNFDGRRAVAVKGPQRNDRIVLHSEAAVLGNQVLLVRLSARPQLTPDNLSGRIEDAHTDSFTAKCSIKFLSGMRRTRP